jgi:hypothetical protein
MQPLHVVAIFLTFRDHEDGSRIDVNDRGGADTNLGMHVRCTYIRRGHGGRARGGPMSRADHARLPEGPTIGSAVAVGVEGVHRIMFCSNKDYVMRRLIRQGEIAHIEWLCIHLAIDRVAKQLAKRIGVDIGRSKNGLLRILALMRIVIAPGQYVGSLRKEGSRRAQKQETWQQEPDKALGWN